MNFGFFSFFLKKFQPFGVVGENFERFSYEIYFFLEGGGRKIERDAAGAIAYGHALSGD